MAKSKVQKQKEKQGYNADYKPMFCMHCRYYSSKIETLNKGYGDFQKESELRCGLGGFALKKKASCNDFVWRSLK